MLPIQVKLQGFMSYRDEATLNFDGSPLWMLSGHNGAGKSTVFDAMKFALYGTHRRGTQFADGLINHDASSLSVEFDFQAGPDIYRVTRTLTRKGRSTFQAFHIKGPNSPRPGSSAPQAIAETDSKTGLKRFIENYVGLNEETFSSAVMLQQGKSDALLSADAETRHGVLSQIVDLTAFEELHRRTEEGYKTAKVATDHINKQLTNWPPVDEAAIAQLNQELDQLRDSIKRLRSRRDELLQLLPQSKRWEELSAEISTLEGQINEQTQTLQQSEAIRHDVVRLDELENQLPPLRELANLSERAATLEGLIASLNTQQQGAVKSAQKAADEKNGLLQNQTDLFDEIARHEKVHADAQTTLIEIGPQIKPQRDWLALQRELAEYDQILEGLGADLDIQLQESQGELDAANETKHVLPELKRLLQVRKDWSTARNAQEQAREQLTLLDSQLRAAQSTMDDCIAKAKDAEGIWSEAEKSCAITAASVQTAQESLARFAEIEHEPTCHYCGQTLDESHLAMEQTRLQNELDAAEDRNKTASNDRLAAHANLMATQSAQSSVRQSLDSLNKQQQK